MRQPYIIRQFCPIGPSANIDTDLPAVKPGQLLLIKEITLDNQSGTSTDCRVNLVSGGLTFQLYYPGTISNSSANIEELHTWLREGEHLRFTPGHQTTGGALNLTVSGWLYQAEPEVIAVTEVKP